MGKGEAEEGVLRGLPWHQLAFGTASCGALHRIAIHHQRVGIMSEGFLCVLGVLCTIHSTNFVKRREEKKGPALVKLKV
jgi:hypothetical protein